MEEACETKLVYLGDNLFRELLRKPVQLNIAPSNLDEIQRVRILHREHNLGKMFIEHAEATDMNMQNANVVRNITDYITPTDTITVMSSKRTVFDVDYIPETKVEDPDSVNTNYVLNETIGSSMGEIVFPAPVVKTETPETDIHDSVNSILVEHSPQCQLRLQITSISSIGSTTNQNTLQQEYPTPWMSTGSSEDQQSAGTTTIFVGSQDIMPTS